MNIDPLPLAPPVKSCRYGFHGGRGREAVALLFLDGSIRLNDLLHFFQLICG
jgi:hypothetical protein